MQVQRQGTSRGVSLAVPFNSIPEQLLLLQNIDVVSVLICRCRVYLNCVDLQILRTEVEGSLRKAAPILRRENGVHSIPMFQTHGSEQTDETSCNANNLVSRCQEWTVTV